MSIAAKNEQENDLVEVLVAINRVAKVVKGGRRFSFSAIVVVGDKKGRVGFGTGSAREVADARLKASKAAKRNMIRLDLKGRRTIHHDVEAKSGSGRVVLRSARPGTGIIAGGPMRAIFESAGVVDIVAKSIGSSNPHNMIHAAFEAIKQLSSPRDIAFRRGKKAAEIIHRRAGDE